MSCLSTLSVLIALLAALIGVGYVQQKELFRYFVHRNFNRFASGTLCIEQLETKTISRFGANQSPSTCDATLLFDSVANEETFYATMALRGGATGFGFTFMSGLWRIPDTADLGDTAYHFIYNTAHGTGSPIADKLLGFRNLLDEYRRANAFSKSKSEDIESISYHYDLDNAFYALFLGPSLSGYSCGLFNSATDSILEAQDNKFRLIIEKVFPMTSDSKVVDVGSGWGYFASLIANETGAEATGITISKEQFAFSNSLYASQVGKGSGRVNYELLDYRDLGETHPHFFDRAVSIGMVEHVGLKRLSEYFSNVYASLKPDSTFLLHYVSRTDIFPNWRATTRANACSMANYISEYIFPGGCILHSDWVHEEAELAGFRLMHSETFGHHYMKTLRKWRQGLTDNFWANYEGKHKGDATLFRQYEFYFAFCEAAFRTQRINLVQMLLYKPREDGYQVTMDFEDKVVNPNMRV